ncbi:MAG TPA: hypothetical protein DDX39_02695 [Bacteroidales bacterium]|nr:MAG: hypothetical protein A2W98_03710 [Bacteroidetes bacterium GWF2_33_38]OFY76694.1 MAG: hypothetical protein A2265_08155 [Bacteroidetes bacterium RIFOXYA12_FULL_33_9]OFY84867.1 MAG: hypothetical protein A2236_09355 [Bacteroidetes bacterium RIFOXYA2_FULL_33_7]HBF87525.1 hypothetical protein [Bacteroidales bacterium]
MNSINYIEVHSKPASTKNINSIGICIFFIFTIITKSIFSTNVTSLQNGNWTNASIWSPVVPSFSDNIRIKHSVVNFTSSNLNGFLQIDSSGVLTTLDIDVQNGATLDIYGTMNMSNLTLSNGSTLHVRASGVLAISSDFKNKNNTINVVVDGIMIVGGNFDNGFGGIIKGVGIITTSGSYFGAGETFGINPTSSIPANTTIYSTLPVKLSIFNCVAEKSTVNISWISKTEINNNYYFIERSFDANNYSKIAEISATNQSNSEYKYCDEYAKIGINYYRLWNVDFNGITTLLKESVTIVDAQETEITISPNPFFDDFKIIFNDNNLTNIQVIITDNLGRIILIKKLDSQISESKIYSTEIPKTGIYYLNILENSENIFSEIIIKSDT